LRIPNPADSAGTHELPCDCPCFPSSITKHLEGETTCGAYVASNRAERDSSPKATRRVERMRQQFIRRTHVWPRRGPAEVRGHLCSKLNNLSLTEVPRIIPNRSVANASAWTFFLCVSAVPTLRVIASFVDFSSPSPVVLPLSYSPGKPDGFAVLEDGFDHTGAERPGPRRRRGLAGVGGRASKAIASPRGSGGASGASNTFHGRSSTNAAPPQSIAATSRRTP